MGAKPCHIILKVIGKEQNWSFNLFAPPPLHINWQVLANFGPVNVAISDPQIASRMCFYCCSLQYYQSLMRNRGAKIELKKKWAQNIWVSGITFLDAPPPPCVTFYHFFREPSPPILFEWPLMKFFFFLCWAVLFFTRIKTDPCNVFTRIIHGAIMRTGITCKKIPCYMWDTACRWLKS